MRRRLRHEPHGNAVKPCILLENLTWLPANGSHKTLKRRDQRIKARKLQRSKSTESNKSSDSNSDTVLIKTEIPILVPKVDASSTVKPHNAWDKPLKLVQSDVNEASVVPTINRYVESPPKEEDHVEAKKQESQLVIKETAMVPRLTARQVYTPSFNVASIPTEVAHASPFPQTFPTNAYPRVTPLPIHTYPIASASLPAKEIYNSLSSWHVSPDHVIAMDCEMVGVGEGGKRSMLARVSLVDWNGTGTYWKVLCLLCTWNGFGTLISSFSGCYSTLGYVRGTYGARYRLSDVCFWYSSSPLDLAKSNGL